MSSICIEATNENKLTVEEYVRYIKIKEHIQQVLENAKIEDALRSAEDSISGLTIDLTIKYSIDK
ncbi:Uncharacterised protein [uncultured archaeon]|nr:Uncharacterised protein [uncultured archaeon]